MISSLDVAEYTHEYTHIGVRGAVSGPIAAVAR
jgi:hypothetical protein